MRILHLNFTDIKAGGAGIAAYRFHKEMLLQKEESIFFVRKKSVDDVSIRQPNRFLTFRNKLNIQAELLFNKLLKINGSLPFGMVYDLNYAFINKMKPDIINMHWIHGGFISLASLSKIKAPIVWTLHDMWVIGKLEHYFDSIEKKNSYIETIAKIKDKFIDEHKNLSFVTPSNWLKEECYRNPILSRKRIEKINNGIDLEKFKPESKEFAKKQLGLSPVPTILLGAFSINDYHRKGIDLAKEAISRLYQKGITNLQIAIFGTDKIFKDNEFFYDTFHLGKFSDEEMLKLVYAAADVFLLPSRADNLPNTGLESLACGTPIVGFNVGGIPEIVKHKFNGYIANSFDTEKFSEGIEFVIENKQSFANNAREVAIEEFDIKKNAARYLQLYEKILNKKRSN